jgi:HD-GYP domain-containing protein (c-di-GMP phosphodiesterase class II)
VGTVKEHCRAGYEIVSSIEYPWPIADIVLHHHERLDGSGYPDGLRGDERGAEARIVAVADVVEAMASHRPYRPSRGLDVALAEIENGSGWLFDATAVEACLPCATSNGCGSPAGRRPRPCRCPRASPSACPRAPSAYDCAQRGRTWP